MDLLERNSATLSKPGAQNQVIFMFSHSCGISPFLKVLGYKGPSLEAPDYCTTIAARVGKCDGEPGYVVEDL